MTITIDGPAGSGKTSVARELAQRLGIRVLQSGLLYRAAAIVILVNRGIISKNALKNSDFSVDMAVCAAIKNDLTVSEVERLSCIEYGYADGAISPYVLIDGQSVEKELSTFGVGLPASVVSQHPLVREWAVAVQRAVALRYDVVAEGRDCGTVVFPQAEHQFFLTASLEVRQKRVAADTQRGVAKADEQFLQKSILDRDLHDQTRKIAPLVASHRALIVDTSALSLQEVVDFLLKKIIEQRSNPQS